MIGNGRAPVGLVHVDDVVAALIAASRYDGPCRAFNIAGPDDISWVDLVTRLTQTFDLPPTRHMPRIMAMIFARIVQVLCAARVLRTAPLTPFAVKFLTEVRRYPIHAMCKELGVTPRIDTSWGLQALAPATS